jgi:ankyrin repeat protein
MMKQVIKNFGSCGIAALLFLAWQPVVTGAGLDIVMAAKEGRFAKLESLLKQKADVNAAQADGTTALAWAVYNDDVDAVDILIRAGADVNASNDYGISPLHLACTNENAVVIAKLLAAGADPDPANWRGETPLMTCANTGATDGVKLLVAKGADVNVKESRQDQTPLMWAAAENNPDIVKILVDAGADVNAVSRLMTEPEPFLIEVPSSFGQNFPKPVRFRKTSGAFTPLLFAAQSGDAESARILLEAGASINYATEEEGSALVVATAAGHEALAHLLLEKGADPNITDGWGVAPIHYAVHEGVLIMNGYSPVNTDYLGWERKNMPELLRVLLDRGANPEARIRNSVSFLHDPFLRGNEDPPQIDISGATALLLAAASGDTASMRILVEKGQADKKATTDSGATLFMLAAGSGAERGARDEKQAIEAARLALAMGGVDVNHQLTNDDAVNGPGAGKIDGRTAAHFAAGLGWDEMIRFLAENGADLDVEDRYGQTPLMIAMGDPQARYYRNIPIGRYDDRYRRPPNQGFKDVVNALLEMGAKPFTGIVIDKGSVN